MGADEYTLDQKEDAKALELPVPLHSLASYIAPDGRVSCVSLDTIHLWAREPFLHPEAHSGWEYGPAPELLPWQRDAWWCSPCGDPDALGITPKVYYNCWQMPTRNRHYQEGGRNGLTLSRFEVGRLYAEGETALLPVDPVLLGELPALYSTYVRHLDLDWMAEFGEASRFDLVVHLQLRSEEESDRLMRTLVGLRDYWGLVDAYDGKGRTFVHPDRPGSLSGVGMKPKPRKTTAPGKRKRKPKPGWVFVAYRMDLNLRKKRPELEPLAHLVVRLEFRFLTGGSIAKFLPDGTPRTLGNLAQDFRYRDAFEFFLGKRLHLTHVADPARSDDEVIGEARHRRGTKERLRVAQAACRSHGVPAVYRNPPPVYRGDLGLLRADLARLNALGLTPWATDREMAVLLPEMVMGAAIRFQEDLDSCAAADTGTSESEVVDTVVAAVRRVRRSPLRPLARLYGLARCRLIAPTSPSQVDADEPGDRSQGRISGNRVRGPPSRRIIRVR